MIQRLIQAVTELLEAKAELMREEISTLDLGTYARGYQDGRHDMEAEYGDCDCPECEQEEAEQDGTTD
jgi:hypothetical protein